MEFSPEQIRLIKIFFKLLKAQGFDEVRYNFGIDDSLQLWPNGLFSKDGRRPESLPQMNDLIDRIVDSLDTETIYEDVYNFNYGEVDIIFDVKNKEIRFEAGYNYYDSECSNESYSIKDRGFSDEKELMELFSYFEKMNSKGIKEGKVSFNGGGDDGWIDETLYVGGNSIGEIPKNIGDLCYDLLNSYYGGWEINEGSQGDFILHFDSKEIEMEFCLNVEKFKNLPHYQLPKPIKI